MPLPTRTGRPDETRGSMTTDKLMLSVTAYADELERERARQRTRDALLRKARAGSVTGGRVFGYDNVEVLATSPEADGRRRRLSVKRVINEADAVVVRRIFERYAQGAGFREIAHDLNAARTPAPRPRAGRPRGWRRRRCTTCSIAISTG